MTQEAEITLPDAMMVERGCIAATASLGIQWQTLNPEMRSIYRVVVNAALLTWGAGALPTAQKAFEGKFQAIADEVRTTAQSLEFIGGLPEPLIEALYRAASQCEVMGAVVLHAEEAIAGEPPI